MRMIRFVVSVEMASEYVLTVKDRSAGLRANSRKLLHGRDKHKMWPLDPIISQSKDSQLCISVWMMEPRNIMIDLLMISQARQFRTGLLSITVISELTNFPMNYHCGAVAHRRGSVPKHGVSIKVALLTSLITNNH